MVSRAMLAGLWGADLMKNTNTSLRQIAFEVNGLSYNDMLGFAQGVGEALGVLDHTPTGMSEDVLTTEAIASALSGWADEHLEDEDRI